MVSSGIPLRRKARLRGARLPDRGYRWVLVCGQAAYIRVLDKNLGDASLVLSTQC